MKISKIYTNNFPKKGFTAITLFPFVFVRKDRCEFFTPKTERHETTHALQQLESLYIIFFVLYGLEWILKLLFCKLDTNRAYYSISFEQEAYEHQDEIGYNNVRKHYAWLKYVLTLK